jgi:YD repeat-containing protein
MPGVRAKRRRGIIYVGWRVVEEQDDSGDTLATYVYGNYIDEVLQMRRDVDGTGGPEDYYYLHDDMHNVMALTDASGTVVERYQYDDYGQPTYYDGSFAPLGSAFSAYDNPYLFTARAFTNRASSWNKTVEGLSLIRGSLLRAVRYQFRSICVIRLILQAHPPARELIRFDSHAHKEPH